jgi:hypothetical protein
MVLLKNTIKAEYKEVMPQEHIRRTVKIKNYRPVKGWPVRSWVYADPGVHVLLGVFSTSNRFIAL